MDDQARGRYLPNRELRVIPRGWRHPLDAAGDPIPLAREQMPVPADGETELVAYETLSEGRPLSPPFPNTPQGRLDLVSYCAEHCTTFARHRAGMEAWAAILFSDAAVDDDGRVSV